MAIKSNNPAASFFDFFSRSGTDAANAAPPGAAFLASGGNISDGVAPGNGYLYHVFTTPGTFIVTGSGVCEYVVVGGGGGGGNEDAGGGGGAGAFRTGKY